MITGYLLQACMISAANSIRHYRPQLNALNVFPVADRDTGTNLSYTLDEIARALSALPSSCTVSQAAECIASSALQGAKGNSGTIFSLLFSALPQVCCGLDTVSASAVALALRKGEEAARRSIQNPAEGTMLTVCRAAAQAALSPAFSGNISDPALFRQMCTVACRSAAESCAQNPVLNAAQVIDAGALGFCICLEAMEYALEYGGPVEHPSPSALLSALLPDTSAAAAPASPEYTEFPYCTEFTVSFTRESPDLPRLRDRLSPLGDCLLLNLSGHYLKVHLHTAQPVQAALLLAHEGTILRQKAENMRTQMLRALPVDHPDRLNGPYLVAGCGGDGFAGLFADLNVDYLLLLPAMESLAAAHFPPALHLAEEELLNQTRFLLSEKEKELIYFPNREAICGNPPLPVHVVNTLTEADCCNQLMTVLSQPESRPALILDSLDPDLVIPLILSRPEEERMLVRLYYGRTVRPAQCRVLEEKLKKAFPLSGNVSLLPGGQEKPLYISFLSF